MKNKRKAKEKTTMPGPAEDALADAHDPLPLNQHKQIEQKLTLYKEIFDNSTDGIAIIDLRGYYLEQNSAHHSLLGYSDEELRDKTPAIHLGDEVFSMVAQELATSGRYRGEVVSHTKSGASVPVELSAFAVRNDLGEPIYYVGI